jgi:hypothetical protein
VIRPIIDNYHNMSIFKNKLVLSFCAGCQWLTPVILTTQDAEIRRTAVLSQPGQIVRETLSQKYPSEKRTVGVA